MDQLLAQSKLRELLGAVEALSEGLAVFDAEDDLILCNGRFRALHPGMETLLTNGLSWRIFVAEAQQRGCGRGLDQIDLLLNDSASGSSVIEASRPGGKWVRLRLDHTPSGGFILTVSDITEAHQAAELRAEADGLLRQVLDACSANLMMTRIGDGEILYRNPASAQLFGVRNSAREVFEDTARRPDMLAELLAAGYVDDFEVNLVKGDGTVFPGRVSARLVEFGGEKVIVSSAADMTQLYAQRDELDRQREATFQNEKLTAMGELLAGVAHELNNPLSVVVGQALMLQEEVAESTVAPRVEKIRGSAERCAKIVKTFLAMARQRPVQLEPVSLNAVLETAVDVAGFGIRAMGGRLDLDLASDLPLMRADEDQIAQVVVNLLVNAEQAIKHLGRAAHVVLRSYADPMRKQVIADVMDNGPGIPAEVRARIFEPFFTTKDDGAGVGLALCHRIVASHSGTLEAHRSDLGGALFRITLQEADTEATATGGAAAEKPPPLHALIVEDEEDVAGMLSDMLEMIGVSSKLCASAEDAIATLEAGEKPDVILSDLVMPGIGGAGLLARIRQRWPKLEKRMAFVTGDSLGGQAQDLGKPVLEKPVAPHELRALLAKLIHRDGTT